MYVIRAIAASGLRIVNCDFVPRLELRLLSRVNMPMGMNVSRRPTLLAPSTLGRPPREPEPVGYDFAG